MSALPETRSVCGITSRDPLFKSIELLVDAICADPSLKHKLDALREELVNVSSVNSLDPVDALGRITTFVAENHLLQQQRNIELCSFIEKVDHISEQLERVIAGTEMHSQSTYQGVQKAGQVLERQLRDINYRLKTASSMESMKLWLEQRLGIVQARLDDYESMSSQQQTGTTSQLQKLSTLVKGIEENSSQLQHFTSKIERSAFTDPLTGVDNRLGSEAAIGNLLERSAVTSRGEIVFMLCDIDRLGDLNHQLGNDAGNLGIQHVARGIRGVIGSDNYLARLGSDQFAIILFDTNVETAHHMADKLCSTIEHSTFEASGRDVAISISCGYSDLRAGDSKQELYRRTDSALKAAKVAGGNCCWFDEV